MLRIAVVIYVALMLLSAAQRVFAECPGDSVLFAKLMHSEFALEYEGCTVTTEAQFVAAGQTEGWVFGAISPDAMAGRIALRVLAPGTGVIEGGAFGFVPPHVFVDKSAADLVFDLKRGEMLTLTGHPVIGRIEIPGAADFVQIIFVADSLRRSGQSEPPIEQSPTGKGSSEN